MTHLNVIFIGALRDVAGHDLPAIWANAVAGKPSGSIRSMLLFSAGHVMQAIDGEAATIRSEFKRLVHSPYFRESVVLNEEKVPGPSLFGNSLGAQQLPLSVLEKLPADVAYFSLSEGAVTQRVGLGIARNLLRQFAADYS